MALNERDIPTPDQAKHFRSQRIDGLINSALEGLIIRIKEHNFDSSSSLIIGFNEIIRPFPELSQYDAITIIEKLLQRRGWFTKRKSDHNQDYLIISTHSLIERS